MRSLCLVCSEMLIPKTELKIDETKKDPRNSTWPLVLVCIGMLMLFSMVVLLE